MPVPVLPALIIHSTRLTAYDETGSYTNGRWGTTRGTNYNFKGSLQPSNSKDLQILPEGEITTGGKTCQTARVLYINDTDNVDGQEARQTFIIADGEVWRVRGVADWFIHSTLRRYVCTKHFEAIP